MKKLIAFIYGSCFGLIRRFRFYTGRQGFLFFCNYRNNNIIKLTGVGNCEKRAFFYPSVYHYLHNIPCIVQKRKHDYLVAQNFLHSDFLLFTGPKVFITMEPPPAMTEETRKNMQSAALKPLLYLYSDSDIKKRMYYPALDVNRKALLRQRENALMEVRPRLCCIINRYSEHQGLNLLRQRIRFVEAMGKDIDIYGDEPWGGQPNKWTAFPTYHGKAEDKRKTLKKYNFVLAFENCDYTGYITEKIFDAFQSGTIPLYWGGGEFLKESIPPECYIDCRNQDPVIIYRKIRHMTQEEIISFRKAAFCFLRSDAADRFTAKYLRREVIKRLEGQAVNEN